MLAVLLFSVLSQTASAAPQPVKVEGATAYVYKTAGANQLRLHVFQTKRGAPKPAIVFFFGGGWMQGNVAQFAPQAKHLAERGMVAILADYRVRNRHRTTPFDAMADARSALRWVRSHASQLGVDPNRIVAAGGSSGGHLALSTAVFDAFDEPGEDTSVSAKPNALVLFNPAVDTLGNRLFGDRGRDGSPLHHVRAGLPPTLIMHGKADMTVPYSDVERFCSESSALGNQCRLVGYDGAPHGFFNTRPRDDKWYQETLLEADRFLTAMGYLPRPYNSHRTSNLEPRTTVIQLPLKTSIPVAEPRNLAESATQIQLLAFSRGEQPEAPRAERSKILAGVFDQRRRDAAPLIAFEHRHAVNPRTR